MTTQPAWTRAAVLRCFIEMTLGDAQRTIVSNDSGTVPAQRKAAFDSASKFYDQSRDILLRTTKSAPEELDAVRLVSSVYWDEGDLRKVAGRSSRSAANQDKRLQAQADDQERGALDFYNRALETVHAIEGVAKSSTEVISYKAGLQSAIGDVYNDLNQPQKAVSAYNESVAAREALATARPGPVNFGELSMIHVTLGDTYRAVKDSSKASSEYTLANTWVTKALQTPSQSTTYLANSAVIHSRFADIALDRNDVKTALDELDTAISTDWTALQSNYADPLLNSNMDKFRSQLEDIQKAIGPGAAANLSANASSKAGGAQNPDLTPEQAKYMDRIQKLLNDKDPSSLLSQYGQTGVALRPLIHGAWRVLNGAEFSKARVQLLTVAKNVKVGQVQGIRKLPLDFYEGGGLYEAVVKTADGKDGVVDFVSSGERSILLDGSLEQIDEVNKNLPLKLDNPERASAYLHFWIGARQLVDDGRLELVDGIDDLDWLPSATAEQRATIIGKATPLVLEAGANGTWNAIGSIELNGQLDQASFNLLRDGTFKFPREKPLESYLPIMVDAFEDGIRIRQSMEDLWQASIKSNPNDQTALTRLAAFYGEAGRWKDAIPAYKNLTAYLERQSKDNPSRAKNLQSAYFSLSVAQVFSQDFAGALATTDTWKKFAPDDLEEHRMRDHALLFLSRTAGGRIRLSRRRWQDDWLNLLGEANRR